MDAINRNYKKAKGKVKDLLRRRSRQNALTVPTRSPRRSQEPEITHGQVISAAPKANATSTDTPALETEPSLRPAHAPTYASTSIQSEATYGQNISTTPSVIVPASQKAVAPTANTIPSADIPTLETEPLPRPEHAPACAANSAQLETTHAQVISTRPSAIIMPASHAPIAPTANATPDTDTDIPALETEPSPRPEHVPNYAVTSAQSDVRKHGEERQAVEAEELKKKLERTITTS